MTYLVIYDHAASTTRNRQRRNPLKKETAPVEISGLMFPASLSLVDRARDPRQSRRLYRESSRISESPSVAGDESSLNALACASLRD